MSNDRRGTPSPLPYYLTATAGAHLQAMALTISKSPSVPWAPELASEARNIAPEFWDVFHASINRQRKMLHGLDIWQTAPVLPPRKVKPTIWKHDGITLHDFGGDGQAALVIPSLINRPYILDLENGSSFLGQLCQGGLRPILLDWGSPTDGHPERSPAELVSQALVPAIHYVAGMTQDKVAVVGYCMGGSLAIALAQQASQACAKLVTLGAPWNFSELAGVSKSLRDSILSTGPDAYRQTLKGIGRTYGAIPAELFQYLFAVLAPMQLVQKYCRLTDMKTDSPEQRRFFEIESWVNDQVAVSTPVAVEVLIDWYCENATGRGAWEVNGRPVLPQELACPALSIMGKTDHIVPPKIAARFAQFNASNQDETVNAGHVGMVAGHAHAKVAYRVCQFIQQKNIS